MNNQLRNYVTSALLLLPAAVSLSALPSTALAQPALPEVRALDASADGRLEAGTRLTFRMDASPGGDASVRIRGLRENIGLREVRRGEYVGGYTIKRGDDLDPDAQVRATLRAGNRTAVAEYELGQILPRNRGPLPPRVVEPKIERFGISPLERIEPGVDIRFALEGTPGGTAIIDLPGVRSDLALREVRPGFYEGSYTIRRADNFNPSRPIVATLRVGDRVSTTNVPFPTPRAAADNRPPSLVDFTPREGEVLPAGPAVQLAGRFEDRGGSGVDPASVQIVLSGRNVTREAQVNRESFNLRAVLPPGRHTVDVTARDNAGNVLRKNWSFDVAAAVVAPPPPPPPPVVLGPALPASLVVQVMNHQPNEEIGPDPVLVRGRTAPNATVAVNVHAQAPQGLAVDHSRTIFNQTLQADREGIFAFTMVPGIPVPGTRYDIVMRASRGGPPQETRFTLMQR